MSVNVETKNVVDPQLEGLTEAEVAEFNALKTDVTIQPDVKLCSLVTNVDNVEAKLGGKWVAVAEYVISKGWSQNGETEKEKQVPAEQLKHGKQVILKSLIFQMGKTYKSAQSIRTFIMKLARFDAVELREKMKTGEATVREARQWGRKPQANPATPRSDQARYDEAIDNTVRNAMRLGFDTAKVYADIGRKFAEYEDRKADKTSDAEKAKQKSEMKQAIEETKKQLANS